MFRLLSDNPFTVTPASVTQKRLKGAADGRSHRLPVNRHVGTMVSMKRFQATHQKVQFLRDLCPDVPEEKMREAEELYLRLLELRLRIFERIENTKHGYPQVDPLTENRSHGIDSK